MGDCGGKKICAYACVASSTDLRAELEEGVGSRHHVQLLLVGTVGTDGDVAGLGLVLVARRAKVLNLNLLSVVLGGVHFD